MEIQNVAQKEVVDRLESIAAFASVPRIQLEWMVDHGQVMRYDPGDHLFKSGSAIDTLFIVLKGRFVLKLIQNNQFRIVGNFVPDDIGGALPYSRGITATGIGEAQVESEAFAINKSKFHEMIITHHELTTVFVHAMSTRIRDFTRKRQQDEKMMALGKLSAGLAHELNNPAAAVVRSAQALKQHLGLVPEGFKKVITIRTTNESVDIVNDIIFQRINDGISDFKSMMERAETEDLILDWLDAHDVSIPPEAAETLADFNFAEADLAKVKSVLRPEDLESVINWIGQVLITEKLVGEISDASERIGNLVGSVKSYTHMDQAPERKPVDIHVGILNTLTMLNHKIKDGKVEVEKIFANQLPRPEVYVSELNQVWTNIFDNAIDAMKNEDVRRLVIETEDLGDCISVRIRDTGKGISAEDLERIFDPFFTTKDIGQGTGLGLDMVNQIISQHQGDIKVTSKPGNTMFEVNLPIHQSTT